MEKRERRITIKLIGFRNGTRVTELSIGSSTRVEEILRKVLSEEMEEIMVICGSKQLYPEDVVPPECLELEIYPLASGG